jgi:uncharacterized membrane protein
VTGKGLDEAAAHRYRKQARAEPVSGTTASYGNEGRQMLMEQSIPTPHAVPAGRGWSWITRGFWHFKTDPLAWILIFLVLLGISIVLGLIPIIGGLANSLLWPLFAAGLMYGAREQERGNKLRIAHLFAGFRENLEPLAIVGLLSLGGSILIGILILGMFLGSLMPMLQMNPGGLQAQDPATLAQVLGPGVLIGLLVGLLLFIPLSMAMLFSPALVLLDDMGPMEAIKQSFLGSLMNMLPLSVYGLAALGLLFLGAIPLGLGLLIVWPILTAAIYAAYRDIYIR